MADRVLTARFSASTAGFTTGTNALKQKLTELNTSMEQTRQAVKQANSEIKQYEKELTQLRRETNNGNTATTEQKNRMQELRDRIAQTTSSLGTLRTTEQELRSQIRNTNRELEDQQTAVQQIQSAAASMGDVLKANLASSAIQNAISKLTSSLKTAAEYCYNVGSSFEAGMSQVAAISGATSSELERLTEKAKSLGASTKFTATQVTEAMNYMAMAGWNAEQMLSGIDGVISLAAASGGDLAQVSDIVTDAITAFGLKAEDVGHFSDVLAAAAANANTNVSMMGETFQYCAPIAGALGFSVEDVTEAIGLMANSGVKSSMAGTALRTLFTKLSDEVKITGKNLGEVTIQTSNADGSMRSLTDILNDMRGAFSQLSQSEKSTAAESIAGKYAMTGLLALMNSGADDVDKLRGAIEECDGASADMAQTMQDNTAGAVTIMQSALEGLGIAAYEKFGDKIRDKVNEFADLFSGLTERIDSGEFDEAFDDIANAAGDLVEMLVDFASEALPGFINALSGAISLLSGAHDVVANAATAFVAFKAALAISKVAEGVVVTIKSLTAAIKSQTIAQEALNLAASVNPYVLVAEALAVAVTATVALTNAMDDCNERADKLIDNSKDLSQSSEDYQKKSKGLEDIKKRYEDIEQELKDLQDDLKSQFGDIAGGVDLVTGAFEDQISTLDTLIGRYDDYSLKQAQQAQMDARKAEQEKTAVSAGIGETFAMSEALDYASKNLSTYSGSSGDTDVDQIVFAPWSGPVGAIGTLVKSASSIKNPTLYFEGSYEDKLSDLTKLYNHMIDKYADTGDTAYSTTANSIKKQITDLTQGKTQLDTANDVVERLTNPDLGWDANSWMNEEYAEKYRRQNQNSGSADAGADTGSSTTGTSQKGAFGVDWSDYKSVKKYYKYMQDTGQITENKYLELIEYFSNKLLDPNSDEWRDAASEIYQARHKTGKDPNEEAYDSEKKYLKWRLDMGYVTEEEYYQNLAQLRDKYLDESSDRWRSATLEIHKYQEKQSKSRLDTLKSDYDDAISAIDDRIKQHERDREDQDTDKKIADIEKQLQYDRLDDYSRQQLENKKQELLDEKEETQWQRNQEDLKDELSTVYTMAQGAYEKGTADLNDALRTASAVFSAIGTGAQQTASTVSTVNNNNISMVMNAVNQTADQIASAVMKKLSSAI